MTNAPTREAPSINRGTQSSPTTDAGGRLRAGHGRRNLVLGLVAISVAAVTVGGVQYARVSSQPPEAAPSSKLAEGIGEAYQQGGSVFLQQVPQGADGAGQSAYVPGGSVYNGQVPSDR